MKLARGLIRTGFTLVLITFAAGMLFKSGSLSRTSALIPTVISLGTFILLVMQLLLDFNVLRQGRLAGASATEPVAPPESNHGSRTRFFFAVGWFALLAALIWILGLVIGTAVFSLAFLRGHSRESWKFCISYALMLAVVVGGMFMLLDVPLYAGALSALLH